MPHRDAEKTDRHDQHAPQASSRRHLAKAAVATIALVGFATRSGPDVLLRLTVQHLNPIMTVGERLTQAHALPNVAARLSQAHALPGVDDRLTEAHALPQVSRPK